jgi:hypothetical protein
VNARDQIHAFAAARRVARVVEIDEHNIECECWIASSTAAGDETVSGS